MCVKSQHQDQARSVNIRFPSHRIQFAVWQNKPIRQSKQPLISLPTYTIPEAATFLAMKWSTLYSWYGGASPILRPSGNVGRVILLSFRDLEEAYKVYLLRSKHSKSLQYLRRAMSEARDLTGSDHPLLTHEIDVMQSLALIFPGRGKRQRRAVPLGDSSLAEYMPEVVKAWGVRISKTNKEISPWRYAAEDDTSTPVSLNPEVMSGRLVLTGTRIPVNMMWGRVKAGEKIEEIAEDYRMDTLRVRQALAHIDKTISKVA